MTELPDNMTNAQIADVLVDQGITRMWDDPIEARHACRDTEGIWRHMPSVCVTPSPAATRPRILQNAESGHCMVGPACIARIGVLAYR